MLKLTDFKKGSTAYILTRHKGRCCNGVPIPPEIEEATVLSIGRKYVTVQVGLHTKKFKHQEDIDGLLEHVDFGDMSELFTTRAAAENEIERDRLMVEIRQNLRFMYRLETETLRAFNDALCEW